MSKKDDKNEQQQREQLQQAQGGNTVEVQQPQPGFVQQEAANSDAPGAGKGTVVNPDVPSDGGEAGDVKPTV